MTTTNVTVHSTTKVPSPYLSTTLLGSDGTTCWLYGFRAHDTTARFTLIGGTVMEPTVILDAAPWPEAFRTLAGLLASPEYVAGTLRAVLP